MGVAGAEHGVDPVAVDRDEFGLGEPVADLVERGHVAERRVLGDEGLDAFVGGERLVEAGVGQVAEKVGHVVVRGFVGVYGRGRGRLRDRRGVRRRHGVLQTDLVGRRLVGRWAGGRRLVRAVIRAVAEVADGARDLPLERDQGAGLAHDVGEGRSGVGHAGGRGDRSK